jgi:transposase
MITLPSLRDLDHPRETKVTPRIWLAVEPADMRCGFDRLAELAASVIGQDARSGHLFLFRSRGGDRLKVLYWDRDGFALWYKRLEEGTFRLPRSEAGAASVELRASELAMLLDGIDLRSVKRLRRFSRA